MTNPTSEEIQRVREYECQMNGHAGYDSVMQFGVDGPVMLVCTRCSKTWRVVAGSTAAAETPGALRAAIEEHRAAKYRAPFVKDDPQFSERDARLYAAIEDQRGARPDLTSEEIDEILGWYSATVNEWGEESADGSLADKLRALLKLSRP